MNAQYTHTHPHCDMLVYNRCRYLNIQLWYSAKAEYLAGARYAANNINHILEEASQATQTAVNIAGRNATSRSNISLALKQL